MNSIFYIFSKDFWLHSGILFLIGIVFKLLLDWYKDLPAANGARTKSSESKDNQVYTLKSLKDILSFSFKFFMTAIVAGWALGVLEKVIIEIKTVLTFIPASSQLMELSNTWFIIGIVIGIIYICIKFLPKYIKNPIQLKLPAKEKNVSIVPQKKNEALFLKDGCPPLSLLKEGPIHQKTENLNDMKARLERCFNEYELNFLKIAKSEVGPTITRFTIAMSTDGRIANVIKLEKEMSMFMGVESITIKPTSSGLVIEIPNTIRSNVYYKETMNLFVSNKSKNPLLIPVGKTAIGDLLTIEINRMPHLLIAGTTGSGKSVCINGIVAGILLNGTPEEVKFIFIDPKVVGFSKYNGIPHLLAPVITDPRKAMMMLDWAVQEMDNRYKLFCDAEVEDIDEYNQTTSRKEKMTFIVIVIDELADLMIVSKNSNNNEMVGSVEESIQRLGQKARAAGIHLIVGTQRPSADVITGTIKTNLSGRIAFAVTSGVDSRIILDETGAEKLRGQGDGLLLTIETRIPVRFQSAFISKQEVKNITEWWKTSSNSALEINHIELSEEDDSDENRDKKTIRLKLSDRDAGTDDTISKNLNTRDVSSLVVKKFVSQLALSDEDEIYLPPMNRIAEETNVSKPYLVEQINNLVSEKWLEKSGDSPRNIKYKIIAAQEDAAAWLVAHENDEIEW